MKVFLKVEPSLAAAFLQAGKSVSGLEWVEDVHEAEAMVIDQVEAISQECRMLFVGSAYELLEWAGSDESDDKANLYLGRRFPFEPSVSALCESQNQGQLGDLGILRLHRWVAGSTPNVGRRDDVWDAINLGVRLFDAVPEQIYSLIRKAEATMQIHFGFSGNGMAVMDFAWDLPAGRGYDSIHVIGDDGAAYADDHRNVSLLYEGDDPRALPVENDQIAIRSLLVSLVNATSDSVEPMLDWASMSQLKPVIDAVYRSAEQKQVLLWDGTAYVGGEA